MTTSFTTFFLIQQKLSLIEMTTKYPYKLCRITPITDLSKDSYIEFYVWDETNEKLCRTRIVLSQPTKSERLKYAKDIIPEINKKLISGLVKNAKPKPAESETLTKDSPITHASNFFLQYANKTLKQKTYESYKTDLKRFDLYLSAKNKKHLKIIDFTNHEAIQFLDYLIISKNLTNRSRNNVRGTLSTLFSFLQKRKVVEANPMDGITNLPTVAHRHAALSQHHAHLMKEACITHNEPQLLLYFLMIYYCAIRSGNELKQLKVGDIKEDTIFISGDRIKSSVGRHAIIPDALQKILNEYKIRNYPTNHYVFSPDGVPGPKMLTRDYMYNRHKKMLKIIGIDNKDYTIYSWKHTGVIALWKHTQDIELIRNHCGHADVAITTKYLRDLGQFTDYGKKKNFPEL